MGKDNRTNTYETANDLKSAIGQNLTSVTLLGRDTPNDGFAGTFFWSSASTATEDNINVIQRTGMSTGRWIRVTEYNPIQGVESVFVGTVQQLRNLPLEGTSYNLFITKDNGGGVWYIDESDTTSADNTGTVLIGYANTRYKRIYDRHIYSSWFGVLGDGVVDDYTSLQKMFNSIDEIGGNLDIHIENTGNYYQVSEPVWVKTSNIVIHLEGNIKSTRNVEPIVFFIAAKQYTTAGPFDEALFNIKIQGYGTVIDGNGLGSTAPEFGSFYNACIRIIEVHGLALSNLKINNGVYQNCAINFCKDITIDNCDFDYARDYNGLNINGVPRTLTFNVDDPNTWTNAMVTNCRSYNCDEYGFTAYRTVNVVFKDCTVKKDYKTSAGGFSSECVTDYTLNMRTKFLNCTALGTTKNAFTLQGFNCYMDELCVVDKVYAYEFATEDEIRRGGGNGISVNSTNGGCVVQGTIRNCEGWGLSSISRNNNPINNLIIQNITFENCNTNNYINAGCFSLYGMGEGTIIKNTKINNIRGFGIFLYNGSSVYNLNGGNLYMENSTITNTDNLAISSNGIKDVRLFNILAESNNLTLTSATRALNFTRTTFVTGTTFIADTIRVNPGSSAFVSQGLRINNYETSYRNNIRGTVATPLVDNSTIILRTEVEDAVLTLRGGVATPGDTLNKLYTIINTNQSDITTNGVNSIKRTSVSNVDYTVQLTDYLITYAALTAPRTVTLPSPATVVPNRFYIIKDQVGAAGTNNITVISASGLINGRSSYVINTNKGYAWFYTNGTNWYTFSELSVKSKTLSVSASYAVLVSDFDTSGTLVIYADASSGILTVTIPASALITGYSVKIIKTDASTNAVNVRAASGELINNNNLNALPRQNSTLVLESTGTQLVVISKTVPTVIQEAVNVNATFNNNTEVILLNKGLEVNTANRTITLPTAVDKQGLSIRIFNYNTGSFSFLISIPYIDFSGASISTLPNSSVLTLFSDGSVWRLQNI